MYWPPHRSLQVKNPLILCLSKPQPETSDHHRHGDFLFLIEVIKGNGHETIGHQRVGKKMSSNLVEAEWERSLYII